MSTDAVLKWFYFDYNTGNNIKTPAKTTLSLLATRAFHTHLDSNF